MKPILAIHVAPMRTRGGMQQFVTNVASPGVVPSVSSSVLDSGASRAPLIVFRQLLFLAWTLWVRRGAAVVVHLHVSQGGSLIRKAGFAAVTRCLGKPYVVHVHGSRFAASLGGPVSDFFAKHLLAGAAQVLVLNVSQYHAVTRLIGPDAPCQLLANAVPGPSRLSVSRLEVAPTLIFIGELGSRKGVDILVSALEGILDIDWHLRVCGDGRSEDVRMLHRLPTDRVTHYGWVSPDEVTAHLRSSAIFVLPSRAEGMPLALLQAMAYGVAPVVTDVGGCAGVIEDDAGVLVPAGDIARLRAGLRLLLTDPVALEKTQRLARERWEQRYAMGICAQKLTELYVRVAA